ncbi:MAG: hypothetical protein IJ911_13345 [Salinivirgaceae bacterium]|nr:hypothetical protein [Salinivirgaceae bacterium]
MKLKNINTIIFLIFSLRMSAQTQQMLEHNVFVARTETEAYNIYGQLLDNAKMLKSRLIGYYFRPIENADTIMKIEQKCYYSEYHKEYICDEDEYEIALSNKMSIDFYERFLTFLKNLKNDEHIYNKFYSCYPLSTIKTILQNRYESGDLDRPDSLKVLALIEEITLRRIIDGHSFKFLYGDSIYMTERIKKALMYAIDNPYYPKSYLDYYINYMVDTACLDTTGIPIEIRTEFERRKGLYVSGNDDYDVRLSKHNYYTLLGNEMGITPGQAYIEEKKRSFSEKGYLNINEIAYYAHKTQDSLLIEHLMQFKKNHPDYQLRYF